MRGQLKTDKRRHYVFYPDSNYLLTLCSLHGFSVVCISHVFASTQHPPL